MPAVFMTRAQRSSSLLTNFVYAAPPYAGTMNPIDAMRCLISGELMIFFIVASSSERVNDFAAPGVMNLLRRVLSFSGWRSPMVVG